MSDDAQPIGETGRTEPVIMDPEERCSCGGRRWVDDENWLREPGQERTEHDGLIPCGFCNESGWNTPQFSCPICDERPPAPDDIMCAPCRTDMTAACDSVVDPVEIVLAAHRRLDFISNLDRQECACGWRADTGPALHRRHVAAHIYEALGLDGPQPWVIGPESSMRAAMEAAGSTDSPPIFTDDPDASDPGRPVG